MSKLRNFAVNAGILTATSLSLGIIGVAYNAWLTRNLGSAGMGLFSLMMAVYRFAVTFACSGSGLAATRLVAEENARKNGAAASSAMNKTLLYSLFFGVFAAVLLWIFSDFAAVSMVSDIRAAKPFRILAFSLPFVGVSAALGGYFTAVTRVFSSSAAQIFEQLSQMAFTVAVFAVMKPKDIGEACVLVAAGSTVSEGLAFLLHYILYKTDRRRFPFSGGKTSGGFSVWKQIIGIALPVGASAVLRSALSTVKHLLVPVSLMKSGMTNETALSEYGIVGGMVLPVLTFPCAFLLGFSNLLVPEITKYKTLGQNEKIGRIMEFVFRLTLMFAIGVAAALICWAENFAVLLYNEPAAGTAIRALAPIVTVMYLDSAVDGILKGLGEQVAVVRYNVYDTALCVGLVYTLVPLLGTAGYLTTIVISEVFNMALSASRLVSVTGFKVNMLRWALVPTGAAILSTVFSSSVLKNFLEIKNAPELVLAVLTMVVLYYFLLRIFRCVTKADINLVKRIFKK
ncbi:MAG: polysaccharide biosynthesis C-terminal domain-containing protein [Oscillospiraceae bacterium]|nr:polysaccharide biosynthesis C-terminal domain-containing protein [Oscillospiraceae bacterium]